ncbi:ComEC/Rec2 family competence protein [Erythrobacter litoralis]|uniref:Predicted membrane metal-binding protein n=1 Tax=Erythrobacter litoralis (strain HTCC2594) TaxID=314225 RepID=Q2NA92_ERYLH|nr:ComEC/Rec2 family competence protein [Erythrobacter litoralis]ABC63399.1 predicted membrane metal-binding protein [Erythrobacter litoralis HTCC2594]
MASFPIEIMATGSATDPPPLIPVAGDLAQGHVALQQRPWHSRWRLSSIGDFAERALGASGFDRAPWIAVSLCFGISLWFLLDNPWQWSALIGSCGLAALGGWLMIRQTDLKQFGMAVVAVSLAVGFGTGLIWARSATIGAEALPAPQVQWYQGRVLEREEQPSRDRIRLVLAVRDAEAGEARKIRINVPLERARDDLRENAVVRFRARLMPPAPPMVPGAYNFARRAWFDGYAATGSVLGEIELVEPPPPPTGLAAVQRFLSGHVRDRVDGSAGTIAAAFASGDRGAITEADEEAMRDAGLTHLLSISGLHVSAIIAAAYILSLKLLALWPWLALRVRLPLVAAGIGALAGIGYTLLTGAEVPTVRSCAAAVLVLIALALGREPLSLRMVAVAAVFVLLLWPESLVGPSFQMSFAAVIAIVALHNAEPVKRFLAPREEGWFAHVGRRALMLLVTGLVIEIALMPIVLFHFHRAGVYGALANVIAIPLVTFISMPLIAIALALDAVGLGEPVWWLVGQSLDLLLGIAHFTSSQPGAVKLMPQMGLGTLSLFVAGGLWLALWKGRRRLLGFAPVAAGTLLLLLTPVPDILISGDGRHVGIAEDNRLIMLRESRSDYARDNLMELAGMSGEPVTITDWPGAQCSRDFCTVTIQRGGRDWHVLMARSRDRVEERALAAACERSHIVIADRWLPRSCRPQWLKADRRFLGQSGGLALFLEEERFTSVAQGEGEHGWWRGREKGARR